MSTEPTNLGRRTRTRKKLRKFQKDYRTQSFPAKPRKGRRIVGKRAAPSAPDKISEMMQDSKGRGREKLDDIEDVMLRGVGK